MELVFLRWRGFAACTELSIIDRHGLQIRTGEKTEGGGEDRERQNRHNMTF
jgi:hypothetical protein